MVKRQTISLVVMAVTLAGLVFAGGNKEQKARTQQIANLQPIRTIPEKRPAWVDETSKDNKLQYFVGLSRRYATERVDYYGTVMVNKGREYTATAGLSSDVFSPQTIGQQI